MREPQQSTEKIGTLARRLKEARLKSGLSQMRLGVLAGIDEYSASVRMNRYERGKHSPHYQLMTRLANVLNIPVTYFYAEDELEAELLLMFADLDGERRELVIDYARQQVNRGT